MKAVGIKVLKNNLSRYLKEVQAGELIWITDRDEVIAELHRPTTPLTGRISRWNAFLNEQEKLGKLQRAKNPKTSLVSPRLPRWPVQINLEELLNEVRSERA